PFPGNVRELENAIEYAVAIEKGEILSLDAFPEQFTRPQKESNFDFPITSSILSEARQTVLEAFERKFLIERLTANKGNVTSAAKEAQIQRQSFQRLMKKYHIDSGDYR
ncbi:MAG: helix-turn-helix domain-containing protein, partial [Nitrospirales bacterium]